MEPNKKTVLDSAHDPLQTSHMLRRSQAAVQLHLSSVESQSQLGFSTAVASTVAEIAHVTRVSLVSVVFVPRSPCLNVTM